jgi:hypothetical protein
LYYSSHLPALTLLPSKEIALGHLIYSQIIHKTIIRQKLTVSMRKLFVNHQSSDLLAMKDVEFIEVEKFSSFKVAAPSSERDFSSVKIDSRKVPDVS